MRLAEQDKNKCVRMPAADFTDLVRRVAVARCNSAQILARHTIEPVNRGRVVPSGRKQFAKWSPVISPIQIEAGALPKFGFVNLAARPFVEDVLVAGKNSLDSQRSEERHVGKECRSRWSPY